MVIRSCGHGMSSGHQEHGERSGGKECDGWAPVLMCGYSPQLFGGRGERRGVV